MFENLGYYKEYYVNSKFIGTTPCEAPTVQIGYEGRQTETLKEALNLTNGKKIKAGTTVIVIVYPLSGRILKQ